MSQILVFGASTTYGAWDPEGGWVARLRRLLDETNIREKRGVLGTPVFVYNLGVPGDTAEGILQRLKFETEQRADPDEDNIFIFQVGLNDSLFDNKTQSLDCSPKDFQEDLEEIIRWAKKFSNTIIFIGTLPVDERVDPIPWLEGYSYKNEYIEEYNEITKSACRVNGAHFVEIYQNYISRSLKTKNFKRGFQTSFINTDYQKLLEDGVHGNAEGHKVIFEAVRNYMVENNIIEGFPTSPIDRVKDSS